MAQLRFSILKRQLRLREVGLKTPAGSRSEIILFGGGEIYKQGLDYCHRVERTVVAKKLDGVQKRLTFPN